MTIEINRYDLLRNSGGYANLHQRDDGDLVFYEAYADLLEKYNRLVSLEKARNDAADYCDRLWTRG